MITQSINYLALMLLTFIYNGNLSQSFACGVIMITLLECNSSHITVPCMRTISLAIERFHCKVLASFLWYKSADHGKIRLIRLHNHTNSMEKQHQIGHM